MSLTVVGHVVLGAVAVVGGAAVAKFLDPASGAILAGFGGTVLGRLLQQPAAMRPGAVPDKEQP